MKILSVIAFIVLSVSSNVWAYTPPKGIPNPSDSWGVFGEIDQSTPSWPSNWTDPSTSAAAGYYYVDKTDGSCSDASNGHPDTPRCHIPEGQLSAGDFIYINAGTYTGIDSAGDRFDWYGAGTAAQPIWISGNPITPPVIQDLVHFGAIGPLSYLVFENISINSGAAIRIYPGIDGDNLDHIILRNISMTGTGAAADTSAILIGISQPSDFIPNSLVSYIVIYNSIISAYGDKTATDECGIYNGYHTSHVWALNNIVHDVAADSIAGSHYANDDTKKTEDYYIGGNTLYGNGENGIDLKGVRNTIISENTIYGPFAREQGSAIVLHYGAAPSTTVKNAWVIFNNIYHVSGGISTSSVGCDNLNIVGNLIYDVDADYAVTVDPENGRCVLLKGGDGTFRIVDNTFYSYDSGISIGSLDGTDQAYVHGNIFLNRNIDTGFDILEETDESKILLDYNYFYPVVEDSVFTWGGSDRTLSYMQTTASQCANCAEGDPGLSNPSGGDFSVASGSSAVVDASVEGPVGDTVYDAFYSTWGVAIEKDYAGVTRPQGAAWDIGAYEYQESAPELSKGRATTGKGRNAQGKGQWR